MPVMLHSPPNTDEIREFYVFLSQDEGGYGVVASSFGGLFMPLVTSQLSMVEKMKDEAQHIARESGVRIVLAKFTTREDIWSTRGDA
jgi:hypothetical protein